MPETCSVYEIPINLVFKRIFKGSAESKGKKEKLFKGIFLSSHIKNSTIKRRILHFLLKHDAFICLMYYYELGYRFLLSYDNRS